MVEKDRLELSTSALSEQRSNLLNYSSISRQFICTFKPYLNAKKKNCCICLYFYYLFIIHILYNKFLIKSIISHSVEIKGHHGKATNFIPRRRKLDLNQRPFGYQPNTLPAELFRRCLFPKEG